MNKRQIDKTIKNPDWIIENYDRNKEGEITLWCKEKMTEKAFVNMIVKLRECVVFIDK